MAETPREEGRNRVVYAVDYCGIHRIHGKDVYCGEDCGVGRETA
jgi:hypothetical protein